MNKIASWLFAICSLAAAIWFGFKAYALIRFVATGATQLEPAVYVPLAVTIATAVLGLVATLYTQVSNRRREIAAAHRERKTEVYLDFLKTIETILLDSKSELKRTKLSDNELVERLVDVRTKAVLWGSPGVLRALNKLTKIESQSYFVFDVLEEIQREIRKDLGLSNYGLEKDFFAKLPLSDPESLEEIRAKR